MLCNASSNIKFACTDGSKLLWLQARVTTKRCNTQTMTML